MNKTTHHKLTNHSLAIIALCLFSTSAVAEGTQP